MAELHDSFGESMEKAGYERASDSDSSFSGGGGWREDNSSDSYRSTSDRWNDHKSRYGKDKVYTDAFNERRNNSSWSGGHSAISRTISEKYHSLSNGQMSAAAPEKDQKTLTGGLFGKSYSNAPYSAREDWDNVGFFTSDERLRDIAHHNAMEDKTKKYAGDTVGNVVSTLMGVAGEPVSKGAAITQGITQLGVSKAGTIADKFKDKEKILEKMTPSQRQAYRSNYHAAQNFYDEDMDSFGSRFAGGLATVAGAIGYAANPTLGSFVGTGAKTIADSWRHNHALEHAAEKLNSPALKGEIANQKDAIARASKEDRERRAMDGSNEQYKPGILGSMQQRLNPIKTENEDYNEIPQLINLWNNVSIR